MAAKHSVRSPLFGASVENEHCRLSVLVDSGVDLRMGHLFDPDVPGALRETSGRRQYRKGDGEFRGGHAGDDTTFTVTRTGPALSNDATPLL
jgi:hypothetical protein